MAIGFGGNAGSSAAFNVLGFVGVDDRQAIQALNAISNAATAMSVTATRTGDAAERAFRRFSQQSEDTRRTTISLRGAFEALATASFVRTMESFANSMFSATARMQSFQRTLVGVTGSAAEARKVLREVAAYADKTPIDTDQLKGAAVKFASLKQPIIENLDLAAKLSYLFGVDLPRAAQTVAEANGGVIDALRRLKVEFAFTADQAEKYGAVVSKGHIAIGRPGSETNDRLMKALRAFVADREKGLGGDLFGGDLGIGGAFSNLRSGVFMLLATLGNEVSPLVVTIAKGIRTMIDAFRELPSPILSLVAHFALLVAGIGALVPVFTAIFGFFRLFSLIHQTASALAMLAAAEGTAAGATTLLTASFGPLMAIFAVLTTAVALYQAQLETMDKKTMEASKHLTELHKAGKEATAGLNAAGKSETGSTLQDVLKSNSSPESLMAERDKMKHFQAVRQEEYDKIRQEREVARSEMAGHGYFMTDAQFEEGASEYEKQLKKEIEKYQAAAGKFSVAVFQKSMTNMVNGLKDIANGSGANAKEDPREYHEILHEAEMDASKRGLNLPGSGRAFQARRLEAQVRESEESIKSERQAQINRTIRENGTITAAERKRIESGERDDPEQFKAYLDLRKKLIDVRKEGLEVGQKERDHAERMASIEKTDSYESRIRAIEEERKAYALAYSERTISEEQYDEKIRDLSIRRAEEDQKRLEAQREVDGQLAKLYGDDARAAELEMEKKVQAWRQSGIREVDIEKLKNAEILQATQDRAVKEIQLEQQIADEKAQIRSKRASTQESVLQERASRGEAVGGELRAARSAEGEAQKRDIDTRTRLQRKSLQAQLKAATDPLERRKIQAQLSNLDSAAQAEKEAIDQSVGSRNRSEERAEATKAGEASVGAEQIRSSQLGVKNELLKEKLAAGGDPQQIGKAMLDNIHKQYELNKQILEDKEKLAEAGKTEAEKANLRNQLELDKLKLQEDSLKAARDVTAEIEKQNALKAGKSGFTLGGHYSSYEDAMKADQADSDAMRAKYNAKKDKSLAKKIGFDLDARQNTVFVDPAAARAAGAEVATPGAQDGLAKTHERWNQINEAGKKADLKGRAHLQVTIQAKDPNGRPFDQSVHEAVIPLDKSIAQDLRNPLGGNGGMN